MFYGQIKMNDYLKDPAISFCAIGDVAFDRAPLQVTNFGQGSQLDQLISKIYLERGGGNNIQESYELAAFFYANHCELPKSDLSYFFITGDENFYENITGASLSKIFGVHAERYNFNMPKIPSQEVWSLLLKKFNVFHLHKNYKKKDQDENILEHWLNALGRERILEIQTPKACIDVILGAIAITSGSRTLETYVDDMKVRGQDDERIKEVRNALRFVKSECHHSKPVKIHQRENEKKEEEKGEDEELKEENAFDRIYDLQFVREFVRNNKPEHSAKYTEEIILKRNLLEGKPFIQEKWICPITERLFIYPVKAGDGNTYEENAIETWLKFQQSSPLTGVKISTNLLPNAKIVKEIEEWSNPNAHPHHSPKKNKKQERAEKREERERKMAEIKSGKGQEMSKEEIESWERAFD